jgi:hypothetical protein
MQTRREFLTDVGRGVLVAGLGAALAEDLGLGTIRADVPDRLTFDKLEPLVALMQETQADKLLPQLAERLSKGETLDRLLSAAALANARTFGGEDYVGFHTMMALAPGAAHEPRVAEKSRPRPFSGAVPQQQPFRSLAVVRRKFCPVEGNASPRASPPAT